MVFFFSLDLMAHPFRALNVGLYPIRATISGAKNEAASYTPPPCLFWSIFCNQYFSGNASAKSLGLKGL
jgi:hypothetical protein